MVLLHGRQDRWRLTRRSRAAAFTLLELIIVLSLLVLLALLAWPNMSSRMQASELPESASRLRSTLYMARSGAVMEHRRVRVRFEEGEQQPFVEIERNPFRNPGAFEEVVAAWTQDPAMLGDIQVHSVSLGRPEFLKPLTEEVNPNSSADEAATASPEESDEEDEKTQEALNLRTAVEKLEDPNRPTILFEPDGSTDWALLVVARQTPGEELAKAVEQRWVIVDGRTGRIIVREALTEEELADPELCVRREKLELPVPEADIAKTGLLVAGGQAGVQSGMTGAVGADSGPVTGSMGGISELGQGLDVSGQTQLPGVGGPEQAAGGESGVKKNRNGLLDDPASGQQQKAQDFQASTLEELQQKLDESDLSQEEKKRILESFQEGEKGR